MPPQAVSSPTRRFVLTRLDGVTETNVAVGTLLSNGYATDAPARVTAMSSARTLRQQNPGVVYILYSPSNAGAHTDGDRCWRSDIDYGD
jgi:hypothetical protein